MWINIYLYLTNTGDSSFFSCVGQILCYLLLEVTFLSEPYSFLQLFLLWLGTWEGGWRLLPLLTDWFSTHFFKVFLLWIPVALKMKSQLRDFLLCCLISWIWGPVRPIWTCLLWSFSVTIHTPVWTTDPSLLLPFLPLIQPGGGLGLLWLLVIVSDCWSLVISVVGSHGSGEYRQIWELPLLLPLCNTDKFEVICT